MAYKFARETAGEEPPLPGMTDLSGDEFVLSHFGSHALLNWRRG